MTHSEFARLVTDKMEKNPPYRKGQATFLVAWEHLGEKLNVVLGTDKDPFYTDESIPAFMIHLLENGFFEG